MRSIHPKTSRRRSGFNGTVGCNPFAPARGIPMRTCRGIMREYSSSKTSSGLNVRFADARKKKAAQYRLVHHVQACPHGSLTFPCPLGWDKGDRVSQGCP
jgi:hypothetical protein